MRRSRKNHCARTAQEQQPEQYNQVNDPYRSGGMDSSRGMSPSQKEHLDPFRSSEQSHGRTSSEMDASCMSHGDGSTSFDDWRSSWGVDLTGEQYMSMSVSNKRTKIYAVLCVVLGCIASIAFVSLGIHQNNTQAVESFDRRSSELVQVVHSAFTDYQTAVRNTHSVCRRERNTSRFEFQQHYEYLVADGMDFQAIQCAPNVTNEERPAYEAEASAWYASHYPETVNYAGFKGFEFNNATGSVGLMPRSQAPFYFPIHYSEPVIPNAGALGLDIYSSSKQYREVDLAVATRKPVLSARLKLVQDTTGAYSVIIRHPGIQTTENPEEDPVRDLACLLVRVPDLLARVALIQEESLAAYAYDTTEFNTGGTTDFLGAAEYYINGEEVNITYPEEIMIEDLQIAYEYSDFYYEESIPIASGSWKVVVVPVDDTYEPSNKFVWFGGSMILLTALGLSAYLVRNMRQTNQIYRAKQEAEDERNIVASLFPENVVSQLMQDAQAKREAQKEYQKNMKPGQQPGQPQQFIPDHNSSTNPGSGRASSTKNMDALASANFMNSEHIFGGKPIAEFHPAVTILCANLVGFTSWASVREPSQVFTLLESIFHAFDLIAKRRRVFKVETIGDCYVAAAGVPEPRDNHAVVMARFAVDIMQKVRVVAQELEKSLGPETGEIDMRIGLHSGAVTAGVLRGDKGRFQLFGNTFNITQHMESTGTRGCIHASSDTRELVAAAGKGNWLHPRPQRIAVRGRGQMQTYYVEMTSRGGRGGSVEFGRGSNHNRSAPPPRTALRRQKTGGENTERLVDWNVRELSKLLRTVMARREAKRKARILDGSATSNDASYGGNYKRASVCIPNMASSHMTPLEEVKDVVALPKFDAEAFTAQFHTKEVTLGKNATRQLHGLVTRISALYKANPFHNFEHASHVAMSVTKMLSRIDNPKELAIEKNQGVLDFDQAAKIHDYTLGITSDPLTHFAAFFAALIHDAGHVGIPNSALIKEDPTLASKYNETSVAEQNSLDVCWELLMQDSYVDLRRCICEDADELAHFRELLILMVMSTDVMDKNLNQKRKDRWHLAFSDDTKALRASDQDRNRKATIIIEHLIQASDVSHTMQHWNIYSKWNRRLFKELYHAYQQGRMDTDPSKGWYKGEIGFLDFYVIPLARKLDTCGVFGVSSDEFAFYASENRKEWEVYGEEMVAQYLEEYHKQHKNAPKGRPSFAKSEESSTQVESEDSIDDVDEAGKLEEFTDEISL